MRKLPWTGTASAARALSLAAVLCAAASAADFTALKPTGYVNDFANVVDAASKAKIEQYCAAVEKATEAQIAIVTLPSLQGEPVEDVANAIFRKWGVGQKGKDNGALLLLSINDRRSRLEIGYGLEPIIPDGFAGDILRSMRPYLRQGQYGAALETAAADIGSTIAKAKGVTINVPEPAPESQRETEPPVPWLFIIIAGIFLLLMLGGISRRGGGGRYYGGGGGVGNLLTGIMIGNMLGGRGGSRSDGGGFGGFDGGGFGGFGGGDSGGGGASSDW